VDLQYLQWLDFEGELRTIDMKISVFFKRSQIAVWVSQLRLLEWVF
jgi:hypothetical protein